MPKLIPHENIEYTFRIKGKAHRLVYLGLINEKGKFVFENQQYKNLTAMTQKTFSYFCQKCLICKKQLIASSPEEQVKIIEKKKFIQARIYKLKKGDWSANQIEDMKAEIGLSPEDVLNDLKVAFYNVGRNPELVENAILEYNFFCRYLQRYRVSI